MGANLDVVLNLKLRIASIARMGRRVCTKCGISYHVVSIHRRREILVKLWRNSCSREDDKEETVLQRLMTYHKQTEPLIEYYKKDNSLSLSRAR